MYTVTEVLDQCQMRKIHGQIIGSRRTAERLNCGICAEQRLLAYKARDTGSLADVRRTQGGTTIIFGGNEASSPYLDHLLRVRVKIVPQRSPGQAMVCVCPHA